MRGVLLVAAAVAANVVGGAWMCHAARGEGGNAPPMLESFSAVELAEGVFALEGQVSDEAPDECLVEFGGVAAGHLTICNPDGSFSYLIEVGPYGSGEVSAQAIDNLGQLSNVREDAILY